MCGTDVCSGDSTAQLISMDLFHFALMHLLLLGLSRKLNNSLLKYLFDQLTNFHFGSNAWKSPSNFL